MKFVATLLVAVFVVASASLAFADCAGHNKAQLVKSQPQEQMTKAGTPFIVAEKAAEPAKPVVKTSEKK
jgi:hypothetical protein